MNAAQEQERAEPTELEAGIEYVERQAGHALDAANRLADKPWTAERFRKHCGAMIAVARAAKAYPALRAAAELALATCAFPVGAMKAKDALERALAGAPPPAPEPGTPELERLIRCAREVAQPGVMGKPMLRAAIEAYDRARAGATATEG